MEIVELKHKLDRRIDKLEKEILDFMLKYKDNHKELTDELSVEFSAKYEEFARLQKEKMRDVIADALQEQQTYGSK